jgi:hypothetical protein
MYGIPADLDCAFLIGSEVVQVCIAGFDVQVRFDPEALIHIMGGDWELKDESGQVIDRAPEALPRDRGPSFLPCLVGRRVVAIEVSPPDWLEVRFDEGLVLRLIDDSKQYESFEIQPLGLIV